ncbi:hypothetical protein PPL_06058 [Heterostelium album PN500]|uniref:Ergosterol biosynthetic protein 28 n=1 Tax=Heterostelium pallidum (strain ATCC 26659 / Pp 5 / PN500) TaxID=670386 RepID=D3BC36_HETP5|nr:hypothetical protein PPL_06058 [Heterostelium album PN500]EFA81219.1 hypothetical protein PPL_06058 [Heterostelium album PN500]|eukprot:XP_020433337.1 hypothetical protein PPL_06058 [Heterostelium album PN500]
MTKTYGDVFKFWMGDRICPTQMCLTFPFSQPSHIRNYVKDICSCTTYKVKVNTVGSFFGDQEKEFKVLMEYIQIWLLALAGLRALGFSQALFNIGRLRTNIYSGNPTQVTGLTARLFAAWTSVGFVLCVATAYNPYNQTLFTVTWTSFVFVLLHFLAEILIFKSSSFKDVFPLLFVSTTSIVWMVPEMSVGTTIFSPMKYYKKYALNIIFSIVFADEIPYEEGVDEGRLGM